LPSRASASSLHDALSFSAFQHFRIPAFSLATLLPLRPVWKIAGPVFKLGRILSFLAILAASVGGVNTVNAQTYTTWNSTSSAAFATAGNWNNGGPIASRIAQFDNVISSSGVLGIAGTTFAS
jgi:hypothetical protein